VVNDGLVDGPQNAVGNVRGAWNLKKVAASVNHGGSDYYSLECARKSISD